VVGSPRSEVAGAPCSKCTVREGISGSASTATVGTTAGVRTTRRASPRSPSCRGLSATSSARHQSCWGEGPALRPCIGRWGLADHDRTALPINVRARNGGPVTTQVMTFRCVRPPETNRCGIDGDHEPVARVCDVRFAARKCLRERSTSASMCGPDRFVDRREIAQPRQIPSRHEGWRCPDFLIGRWEVPALRQRVRDPATRQVSTCSGLCGGRVCRGPVSEAQLLRGMSTFRRC